ncbi:hypothetical protein JHL18_21365 [Clostridium sp. YIM B02505]|uniref:Uncharacterized protein n=1 Tax=Clostridium yunnanense TaxID=2800325 RepID=A0ABS1EV05_9CLOT|nr:hypothetical protein [Clostridium yunnanense]MBK1813175.1 hypothetical protein [Clostridium yunnanense]
MEINKVSTTIQTKDYSNYRNVEKDKEKLQEDKLNYLKDNLVLSEKGKLPTAEDFKELFDWTGEIGNAGYKDGYVNGTVTKYNEILKKIDEADFADDIKTEKKQRLEKAFNMNSGLYASSVKCRIWFIENKDNLGIHFAGTSPQKSYELMDKDTAKQVESDVRSMFDNTKKYYKEHGSLKGINSKIITGTSKTFSSDDLGLLEKMEKHIDDYFGNTYVASDSVDEIKAQMKQKVSDAGFSNFASNIFFDFIDKKFSN